LEQRRTYNGFTNYETWALSLWIVNDWESYQHYRQLARDTLSNTKSVVPTCFIRHEVAVCELAQGLKEDLCDASPLRDQSTVYAVLLNAALSEVDWYELAEDLLDDIKDEK
jgi:hypothetical protein